MAKTGLLYLFLALLKSVSDLLKRWFGRESQKQKQKEDAAEKTGKKTFYCFVLLLILCSGCSYVYTVSTPMTFDPNDYQPLIEGQKFNVPKDGVYFSDRASELWIKAKIAEYEIRKRGFHKEEEK